MSRDEKDPTAFLSRPSLSRVDSGRSEMLSSLMEERGSKEEGGKRRVDVSPGDDGWSRIDKEECGSGTVNAIRWVDAACLDLKPGGRGLMNGLIGPPARVISNLESAKEEEAERERQRKLASERKDLTPPSLAYPQ
ncbi:hypothetical protein HK097_006546, partial [Rhizophlyctis rosea]